MSAVDLIVQTLGAHQYARMAMRDSTYGAGFVCSCGAVCDVQTSLVSDTVHAHQAQAVTEALGLVEHESWHNCTPGCPVGCDVAKVRRGSIATIVIERRKPLTDEEAADLRARIDAIQAKRVAGAS
jgi:hypothetical protein